MIISADTEKTFDKIQHLFMIKKCLKTKNRGKIPQHGKKYLSLPPCRKLAQFRVNPCIKTDAFHLKMSVFPPLSLGV